MEVETGADAYCEDIQNEFKNALGKLIPNKSKDLYMKEYMKFCQWRDANNVTGKCDEKLVMAYLSQMVKSYTIIIIVFIILLCSFFL